MTPADIALAATCTVLASLILATASVRLALWWEGWGK